MMSFKLNWPTLVHEFLSYQERAGSFAGRVFSLECFMQQVLSLDTYF